MRIFAKITEDFLIDVRFSDAPTDGGQLCVMYYGLIRAMKQHNNKAFMVAMDKFISEEIDEMMGDDEND